ncbi:hypothetical protein NIES2100_48290 [Calothrix sp. NIES-2100]|nr:hypothetical protein NIES2100_48290 [Calothrix sp. NIES-2100]
MPIAIICVLRCPTFDKRLIELLNPEVTHYEFFLGRPAIALADWSDDNALLAAIPERNPCMDGQFNVFLTTITKFSICQHRSLSFYNSAILN